MLTLTKIYAVNTGQPRVGAKVQFLKGLKMFEGLKFKQTKSFTQRRKLKKGAKDRVLNDLTNQQINFFTHTSLTCHSRFMQNGKVA